MSQKVIAGLLPFTEYTVRVAAVQGDGSEGEQSSPFRFNTPEGCKLGSYLLN